MAGSSRPVAVEQSRVIPVSVDAAFNRTLPLPLPAIFAHWYGPIPPIKAVRDQTGEWAAAGQTRTVVLVGGGSMHEELTVVDPPRSFGYTLSNIKGPLAALVGSVEGTWTFAATDVGESGVTGTKVTWQWILHPKSGVTAPVLPVLARIWKGYAARALESLSRVLVG
jgi:Polyketide cyclase / dehydrase and lipid transport